MTSSWNELLGISIISCNMVLIAISERLGMKVLDFCHALELWLHLIIKIHNLNSQQTATRIQPCMKSVRNGYIITSGTTNKAPTNVSG
jgi:hypothetical protein